MVNSVKLHSYGHYHHNICIARVQTSPVRSHWFWFLLFNQVLAAELTAKEQMIQETMTLGRNPFTALQVNIDCYGKDHKFNTMVKYTVIRKFNLFA